MTGTSNRPLSSHPAFRWAVGMWFAALLGAGLFVMPDSIHTAIRQSLGIDALIPGGMAGKAIVAGGAGLLGLIVGIVLAMRVAALNAASEDHDDEAEYGEVSWQGLGDVRGEDGPAVDDEPRRPFSPREYFGNEEDGSEAGEVAPADAPFKEIVEEHPVEFAEFEPVEEAPAALVPEATIPVPEANERPDDGAPGDQPLSALTARLERALAASRAAAERPAVPTEGQPDPVIAFLRREADRSTSPASPEPNEDAQAALRSALDRLSQVGRPK